MSYKSYLLNFIIYIFLCVTCLVNANVDQINQTLNKVKALLQKKDFNEALNLLNSHLQKAPNAYQLWIALGYVYESKGEYKKALEAFKKAQSIKVGLTDILAKINHLEKIIKDKELNAQKSIKENHFQILDENLEKLYKKVLQEKKNGNFENAFTLFLECLDKDSIFLLDPHQIIPMALSYYSNLAKKENLDALYMLACYKFYYGEIDDAIKVINLYLSNPRSKTSNYYDIAQTRLRQWTEHKQKIQKDLELAKQEEEERSKKQEKLAELKAKLTQAKAQEYASESLQVTEISAENASATNFDLKPIPEMQYADSDEKDLLEKISEYRKSKPVKAIQIATALVNKKPSPKNYLLLGDLYLEENPKHGVNMAINYYQKIISEFPNSPEAKIAAKKVLSFQPSMEQRIKEVYEYFQTVGTDHLKSNQ